MYSPSMSIYGGDRVRSKTEYVALKANVENDLILQDISEEDLTKSIVTDEQDVDDEIDDVGNGECFMHRFHSLHFRQCPLTIPRMVNGLVDSRTFWKDSKSFRNGLYDSCQPETNVQTIHAVTFPVKQVNANRNRLIPDNDPMPMSIMANYLCHQMAEQQAEMKKNIKCFEAGNENDRKMGLQNKQAEIKSFGQEGSVQMKKSWTARVKGFLKKLCCCVKMNEDE